MMRVGRAWDIAEACAYLGGPPRSYVTGEMLTVDGGGQLWGETWTIRKPIISRMDMLRRQGDVIREPDERRRLGRRPHFSRASKPPGGFQPFGGRALGARERWV